MKKLVLFLFGALFSIAPVAAQPEIESDVIATSEGDLTLFFINHGTLMFTFNDLVIHIDPVSRAADYSTLPKADIILVTHHHGDHLDKAAIETISGPETKLYLSQACYDQIAMGQVVRNGDEFTARGLKIETVPAYNLVHKRGNGEPFHPKGVGNGYVIRFGNKRVYVAGDTENFPEMNEMKDIDVAFLPMNLPYTMTPEMVASAVETFHPAILYPYHYGQTDTSQLLDLLADQDETEVRIRDFY